jgi:hypothetical protein
MNGMFFSLGPRLHLETFLVPAKLHFALFDHQQGGQSSMELPQQERSRMEVGNGGEVEKGTTKFPKTKGGRQGGMAMKKEEPNAEVVLY